MYSEAHKRAAKKWYIKNKEQRRVISKAYWAKPENKEKNRRRWLQRGYGITLETYQALFESQNGLCAICGEKCSIKRTLSVDHNHQTGTVRGLLCHKCNTAIGFLGENIGRLQNVIDYLNKYQ